MSEPHDVPSYREFADLDKRHTALEATVTNQLTRMSSDLTEIKLLVMRPPAPATQPQETAAALALHRALDAIDRGSKGGVGVGTMILIGFGMFGVGVACFLIGKVFF